MGAPFIEHDNCWDVTPGLYISVSELNDALLIRKNLETAIGLSRTCNWTGQVAYLVVSPESGRAGG